MANPCSALATPQERELQQVNAHLNERIATLEAALAAEKRDAERYQELCVNPVGGSHLLNLLAAGKGDQKSLDNMIDRIRASRLAAIQKGIEAKAALAAKGGKRE